MEMSAALSREGWRDGYMGSNGNNLNCPFFKAAKGRKRPRRRGQRPSHQITAETTMQMNLHDAKNPLSRSGAQAPEGEEVVLAQATRSITSRCRGWS